MRVLLSNDDGVYAPGLMVLARAMRERLGAANVAVVAPDRDRSGASNSLTLEHPLRVRRLDDGTFSVNGTPTDCVHLGLTGLLETEPDLVISGINAGANLGDDVLYSGTVAAAMEGRHLGLPAIAVSLAARPRPPILVAEGDEAASSNVGVGAFGEAGDEASTVDGAAGRPRHFETAAVLVLDLLERLHQLSLPPATILNINVPDVPLERLRGVEVTRLGNRHRAEPVIASTDPRGRPVYWVGQAGAEQDAGPGTDFHAIRAGYASITPIHVDLTSFRAMDAVAHWIESVDPIAGCRDAARGPGQVPERTPQPVSGLVSPIRTSSSSRSS